MNILYISKASFILYFKNLHWFALFLLPLPLLVHFFTRELVSIHLYFYLFVYVMSSFLVLIIGIALVDKIQNDDDQVDSVIQSTKKHLLPIIGFNLQIIMFYVIVGVVIAMIGKTKELALIIAIIGLIIIVYFTLRWSLAQTLIVAEDLGPIVAMKRSTKLMKGYKWPFVGLLLISMIAISIVIYMHYIFTGAVNYQVYQLMLLLSPQAYIVFLIISVLGMQLAIVHIYLFYQRRMALLDEENDDTEDTNETSTQGKVEI